MQYLRYWSFREPPFGPAASRFFFWANPQRQTLSWIQEQVVSVNRVGLITASGGHGMTTLFQSVAQSNGFDQCATEVVLTCGRHSSFDRVHCDLAKAMGVTAKRNSLEAVFAATDLLSRRSIRTVWLIDGIGKHSADAAIQISRRCPSMTVIASVTPRLHRLVAKSLGKRIAETQLAAFDQPETHAFIDHSLKTAGSRGQPFSAAAINELHQLAAGRIAKISRLGLAALMLGAKQGVKKITSHEVRLAADDVRQAA